MGCRTTRAARRFEPPPAGQARRRFDVHSGAVARLELNFQRLLREGTELVFDTGAGADAHGTRRGAGPSPARRTESPASSAELGPRARCATPFPRRLTRFPSTAPAGAGWPCLSSATAPSSGRWCARPRRVPRRRMPVDSPAQPSVRTAPARRHPALPPAPSRNPHRLAGRAACRGHPRELTGQGKPAGRAGRRRSPAGRRLLANPPRHWRRALRAAGTAPGSILPNSS